MDGLLFRCADTALVRAAVHSGLRLPAWPDPGDASSEHVQQWIEWVRAVWAVDDVAEAIEHASPVLARQVDAVCEGRTADARRVRRTVFSMTRYLTRMTGRATPFGLFAGVASAGFGHETSIHWGSNHRAVARAGALWMAEVVAVLESCPELRQRLPLVANNLCIHRGARLVLPWRPRLRDTDRAVPTEMSVRCTEAVRLAVEAARSPIGWRELAEKVDASFPATTRLAVDELLSRLVGLGVLLTNLRAPSTEPDALGHLLRQVDDVAAAELPQVAGLVHRLHDIHAELARHNGTDCPRERRGIRAGLTRQMNAISETRRPPLAVDLRLDCELVLPHQAAREVEAAASALARLSAHPSGTAAWQDYHKRFFERYGIGALVPVLDVVDPDVGLGFPAGYVGSAQERRPAVSARDERLLALAQAAALDGRVEVVLDDGRIADIVGAEREPVRTPPHLELCVDVRAASQADLARGEFELSIVTVARGAGTMTGRFAQLLAPHERERLPRTFATLPTTSTEALPVQLSFPPLSHAAAHVARAPELLPAVVSLAEHRDAAPPAIPLEQLAVTCDSNRLYLVSLPLGQRVEPVVLHALDLRTQTPPLARFLAEVTRSQATVVAPFDWGAASGLPYLPRVRYGRTILSPARWWLDQDDLPGSEATWNEWREAVAAWRRLRRVPAVIYLAEGDRRLRLDLDRGGHLVLLRTHLLGNGHAVLTEAPAPRDHGWFGGRSHEIVIPLLSTQVAQRPALPVIRRAPVLGRDHGHLPAASNWLYAKLYSNVDRQAEILAEHLPALLSGWDAPPEWWFIRYRDPQWHLRLRIALGKGAAEFGVAASRVGTWAGELRRMGLLADLQFATYYPEIGRWGSGALMAAAERVFGADSRALVAEFAAPPPRPHPQALTAAQFAAIAIGFTGSVGAGMRWLADHARTAASSPLVRSVLAETVRLADPGDGWAALGATSGGPVLADAWKRRSEALAEYRKRLAAAEAIAPDAVLVSLLHAHHVRAVGIDLDGERTCLRLARAAAMAWLARNGRSGS